MKRVGTLVLHLAGSIGRIFPRCGMVAQAIAFNLFLAFFPTLLIAVGFAKSSIGDKTTLFDLIRDLTNYLPPGSQDIVAQFLQNRSPNGWRWALVGWGGTLIAGSQVMRLLTEGIYMVYRDRDRPPFLIRQLRAVALLLLTIAPLLAAAILGVFGRPLRHWLANEFGNRNEVHTFWTFLFPAIAILLAMTALTIIYRVARPHGGTLREVLPGAMIATLLWWLADVIFGFYVRRVPYSVVYGGLAAVVGLMVWMYLSTMIVLFGAAWNAEAVARSNPLRAPLLPDE